MRNREMSPQGIYDQRKVDLLALGRLIYAARDLRHSLTEWEIDEPREADNWQRIAGLLDTARDALTAAESRVVELMSNAGKRLTQRSIVSWPDTPEQIAEVTR